MVELGRPADNSIIRRMRVACEITKATDTQSEYVILLLFHSNSVYATVSEYYVIRRLLFFRVHYLQLAAVLDCCFRNNVVSSLFCVCLHLLAKVCVKI
jgi:hypothetical protein